MMSTLYVCSKCSNALKITFTMEASGSSLIWVQIVFTISATKVPNSEDDQSDAKCGELRESNKYVFSNYYFTCVY